jgi:hypothetical protein
MWVNKTLKFLWKALLFLWKTVMDSNRVWYDMYDHLFNNDGHYIVSKKGWEILETLKGEELKEFIEKHKDI